MYTLKHYTPATTTIIRKEFKTLKALSQYARRNDLIRFQVLNHKGEPCFLLGNELRGIQQTIDKLQEILDRGGYYQNI